MARFRWLVSLVVLSGCGIGVTIGGGGGLTDSDEALSTVKAGFVTIQHDARKCAAPLCGGYFLSQPNHSLAPIYVAELDFSQSNLADAEVQKLVDAPEAEVLLFGKLTRQSRSTHTRNFIVLDAYRGMPGRTAAEGDAFYSVASNGRQCFAAPCNALTATKVSSTAKAKDFTTLSVASAAAAFVDEAWLSHRALDGGAIVAATFVSGERYPAGTEKVLDASQVFVHLPESSGMCPHHVSACSGGQVNVYQRNNDRCVIDEGCEAPGMCSMMMPACPEGYVLSSWRDADNNACPKYACDPAWL